jgi:hypothetical protein
MIRLLLVIAALFLFPGAGVAREMVPSDFYGGYYLQTPGGYALYRFDLPVDLYEKVKAVDGSDIRVFNGNGEIVPHVVRSLVQPETERESKKIPLFPLYDTGAVTSAATPELSLQVSRDSSGTIVKMDTGSGKETQKTVSGYLLDISSIRRPLAEIELNWTESEGGIGTINIDQSDDLQYWRRLVTQVALADLHFGVEKVVKNTVVLPAVTARYLRLTWGPKEFPFAIVSATARLSHSFDLRELRWFNLLIGKVENKNNRLVAEFRSTLHMPVCAISVSFGQPNSAARLSLSSRSSEHNGWQPRCTGSFYQLLMNPGVLENDPCLISSTSDTLWRAEILDDGSGIGSSGMNGLQLKLGHRSEELLFIARGPKPFLLAYGKIGRAHV